MDRIRVQRLVIYEGPRDKVEATVARSIQGERNFGGVAVFAVTLQAFPEVIPQPTPPEEPTHDHL